MIIPIKKFTVVTLTDYEGTILEGLGRLGTVQVEDLREGEYTGFKAVYGEVGEYRELLGRFRVLYDTLIKEMAVPQKKEPKVLTKIPVEDLREKIDELEKKLRYLEQLERVNSILEILGQQKVNPKDLRVSKYAFTKVGTIDSDSISKFKDSVAGRRDISVGTSPLSEKESFIVVTGLVDANPLVERSLSEFNFKELKLPPEVPDNIDEAQTWVEWETETSKKETLDIVLDLDMGSRIEYSMRISAAQSNLLRSQTTSIISGWIPEDGTSALNSFIGEVNERAGGRLVIYYEDPRPGEEVPTVMKNPRILGIYETLTRQYGIPSHEEIDPTPILGVLWSVMFGLMFPDIGQGLVILLLGAFFAYRLKKPLMGMSFKRIGKLIMGLGVSAMFFGALTGEFFLIEITPLFPGLEPGWLSNSLNVIWLIKIAVFFGIANITAALIINIINTYREREMVEVVLGERGIAGLIIFLGLVLTVFYFIGINMIPGVLDFPKLEMGVLTHWSFLLFIAGVCMLPIKSIIEKEGVISSLGPIIEDVIGFLVNMLSYSRIAGFAIVHAAFAIVVHEMLIKNPAFGIGIGIIFLNFFSLTIELLVVMIQSLRLLYYEFSTKFFRGKGQVFKPFKI